MHIDTQINTTREPRSSLQFRGSLSIAAAASTAERTSWRAAPALASIILILLREAGAS